MKRFLILFMIFGPIAGSVATAEAKWAQATVKSRAHVARVLRRRDPQSWPCFPRPSIEAGCSPSNGIG